MPFPKRSDAFLAGYDAYMDGKTSNQCPYKPKTQEFKDWVAGWVEASQVKNQDQPQG